MKKTTDPLKGGSVSLSFSCMYLHLKDENCDKITHLFNYEVVTFRPMALAKAKTNNFFLLFYFLIDDLMAVFDFINLAD